MHENAPKKIVRLVQRKGLINRNNIKQVFSIIRLSIQVQVKNQKSIGVELTNSEFFWFVNSLKSKSTQGIHVGKKIFVFNSIGDSSVSLAGIENDKSFGVLLTEPEIDILLKNQIKLEFLLKYQNASGQTLQDITTSLFVSVIGCVMVNIIKTKCLACKTGKGKHFICNKYFKDLINKYDLLDSVLNDISFSAKFMEKFQLLMNLLNISAPDRIIQTQINLPLLREDKKLLISELYKLLDLSDGMAYTIAKVVNLCLKRSKQPTEELVEEETPPIEAEEDVA